MSVSNVTMLEDQDRGVNLLLPKLLNQSNCKQSFQTLSECLCSPNLKLAFFSRKYFFETKSDSVEIYIDN